MSLSDSDLQASVVKRARVEDGSTQDGDGDDGYDDHHEEDLEGDDEVDSSSDSNVDSENGDDAIPAEWKYGERAKTADRERVNAKRRAKGKEAEASGKNEEKREDVRKENKERMKILEDEAREIVEARVDAWKAVNETVKEAVRTPVTPRQTFPDRFSIIRTLLDKADESNGMSPLEADSPALRLLSKSPRAQDLLLRLHANPWLFDPTRHPALREDEQLATDEIEIDGDIELGDGDGDGDDASDGGENASSDKNDVCADDGISGQEHAVQLDAETGESPETSTSETDSDTESFEEERQPKGPNQSTSTPPPRFTPYLRTCTISLSLALRTFRNMLIRHPVDSPHLLIKIQSLEALKVERHLSDDASVTLLYAGGCIGSVPLHRLEHDKKQSPAGSSKLFHLLQQLPHARWTAWFIDDLALELPIRSTIDHPKPLSPSQLWMANPQAGEVEQMIIGALSRELGANSAYGGFTNTRFILPAREREIVDKLKSFCFIDPAKDIDIAEALPMAMNAEYKSQRQLLKEKRQVPASHTATRFAANQASAAYRLPDKTTPSLVVAKDIPKKDAFGHSTWAGDVKGSAATLYHSIRDKVVGREGRTPLSLTNEATKIAKYYGPFIDFWPLCLIHLLLLLSLLFLIRRLRMIRPRVMFVLSDKVHAIFAAELAVLWDADEMESLLEALFLLRIRFWRVWRRVVRGIRKPWWYRLPIGDFIRNRVGTIHVVGWGYGQLDYSVMIVGLHHGYFAYRPDLQRRVYTLLYLVAVLHRMAERMAEEYVASEDGWGKDDAEALKEAVEKKANEVGLLQAIERKRNELADLASALTTLSATKPRSEEERMARHAEFSAFHRERASKSLANTMVAAGQIDSATRQAQLAFLQQDRVEDVPTPRGIVALSSEWSDWFLSLRQGVAIGYAVMRSWVPHWKVKDNLAKARAVLAAERQDINSPKHPAFESFSSSKPLIEVFEDIVAVESLTDKRLASSHAYRLVDCTNCGKSGIVTSQEAKHWCGDSSPFKIKGGIEGLSVSKLLWPWQILMHGKFAHELVTESLRNPQYSIITYDEGGKKIVVGCVTTAEADTPAGRVFASRQLDIAESFFVRTQRGLRVGLEADVNKKGELETLYQMMRGQLDDLEADEADEGEDGHEEDGGEEVGHAS